MLPLVVAVLMLVSTTCGENPAVQVVLNNKGLQYGKHVGAGWIQDRLKLISLPEISGKVLDIHYALSGISITQCDFPEPSVEFYKNITGFKTSTSGLSVAVAGEWTTRLGVIHDGGSFTMAIFSLDVTSAVELGKDADGHLSVTSQHCDARVGDVDVRFQGGASWIFRRFVKYFKGRIMGEIESSLCSYVEGSIANLESHLQAMNVSFEVCQDLTFDLPLTGAPVIDDSSMNLGLKGEFYDIKSHTEPPFVAKPFTMPQQPGYMLSAGLSEFTLNSYLYRLFSAGLLQVLITDSMIPPSFPLHLNTSSMGPYIPQLPKLFPGLLMTLLVYAGETPMFSFQPGVVKLDFQGAVKASAIQPNGTETPLFKLNADLQSSGKVWIDGDRLKGSVTMDNFTLTLASSEVGTFQTGTLEKLTKTGLKLGFAKLNAKLANGFVLPRMKHAELVNTVLGVEEGFIAISSDAQVSLTDRGFNRQTNMDTIQ